MSIENLFMTLSLLLKAIGRVVLERQSARCSYQLQILEHVEGYPLGAGSYAQTTPALNLRFYLLNLTRTYSSMGARPVHQRPIPLSSSNFCNIAKLRGILPLHVLNSRKLFSGFSVETKVSRLLKSFKKTDMKVTKRKLFPWVQWFQG